MESVVGKVPSFKVLFHDLQNKKMLIIKVSVELNASRPLPEAIIQELDSDWYEEIVNFTERRKV